MILDEAIVEEEDSIVIESKTMQKTKRSKKHVPTIELTIPTMPVKIQMTLLAMLVKTQRMTNY